MTGAARFFEEVDGGGLAGEEQHLAVRDGVKQRDGEIDSAHSGHDDIRDEEVGSELEREPECGWPVVGGEGVEAAFGEDDGESICDDLFVVDDENDGTSSRGRRVLLRNFSEGNYVEFDFGTHGGNL